MALIESWFNQDLQEPVKVRYLDGNVFSADNAGNLIGVNVFNNGSPASLAGSVAANVIRSDGATIPVSGALSGNKATVVLNQSCYSVPGPISIIVKITASGAVTTLCAVVANVYQATTDTVIDPGTIIPSIETLIAAIKAAVASIPADYSSLWASLATAYSTSTTYSVGEYVTYNGHVYRCISQISSPESWTSAHWTQTNIGDNLFATKRDLTKEAEEVSGRVSALESIKECNLNKWEQGTAYNSSGTVAFESSAIRCRIHIGSQYESITAAEGYSVYVIWCYKSGANYVVVDTSSGFVQKENNVGNNSPDLWVIVKKNSGANILPSEAQENVFFNSKIVGAVDQVSDLDSGVFFGWRQGTTYKNSSDYLVFEDNSLRVRTLVQLDRQYNVIAKTGYQFAWYVCLLDQTGYKVLDYSNWITEKRIPEYGEGYYLAIVARKEANTAINITEAGENIVSFLPVCGDVIDSVRNVFRASVIPEEDLYRSAYYSDNNTVIAVNDARLKKIRIVSGTEYHITTAFTGADADFPLISYFDANDNFISYEVMNVAGVETRIIDHIAHIPDGASWFYVNSRYKESKIEAYQVPSLTLPDLANSQKEVSILFVGNSLTQDGISYLPYLLRHYYPEVRFRFYMWYNGGYTLAQQYQKFVNDQACEEFSVAENSDYWINSTAKMSAILSTYKFDIVSLQEYFNYKASYTDADLVDWNNCRDYITSHYTGGNGLEFVSLFHAPLRSSAETVFNLTLAGNELILKKTISDDMIPNGIAVYRALSTDLDNLGDMGHLSPDGTHTQEGLPCLLQTFVTALWLFDRIGLPRSVYGCPIRITTAIYNHINVPGANLGSGVITGTDAQNILAQEVAIKAYKEGKYYVLNNIFDPS